MDLETEECMWDVLKQYFESRHLNQSKLLAYNQLVTEALPAIVKGASPVIVRHGKQWYSFEFTNFNMSKPVFTENDNTSHPIMPTECRLRNLSYSAPSYVHILWKVFVLQTDLPAQTVTLPLLQEQGKVIHCQLVPYVHVFDYPVMVKSVLCHLSDGVESDECELDDGAYFVINGAEKVLMYRERTAYNQIMCFKSKDNSYQAEVRSEHRGKYRSTSTLYMHLSKVPKQRVHILTVGLPYIDHIPFVVVMRALGVVQDKQIYVMLRGVFAKEWNEDIKRRVLVSLRYNDGIWTQEEGILAIGRLYEDKVKNKRRHLGKKVANKIRSAGIKTLSRELLPHMGSGVSAYRRKALYLCFMVRKLLLTALVHKANPTETFMFDNKDSYFTKRTESPLELLANLTRQYFVNHYLVLVKNNILRKLDKNKPLNIYQLFDSIKVTKGIQDALASGMWHANKSKITQTGVSQRMDRLNFMSTQAQHTKIINHLGKEGNHIAPKLLQNTSYGIICPFNTPEGPDCGLIKNIPPSVHLSCECDADVVWSLVKLRMADIGKPVTPIENLNFAEVVHLPQYGFIFVDGSLRGMYSNGQDLFKEIRSMRRRLEISPDVTLSYEKNSDGFMHRVWVRTDGGRNLRPLIILDEWKKLRSRKHELGRLKWMHFFQMGLIEYVDCCEQATLNIAAHVQHTDIHDPEFSHAEIHGSLLLGISAGTIPFLDHNQGPRNTYQCIMGKQAQGAPVTNMDKRMDTTSYQLWYPERPLVGTMLQSILGFHALPSGCHPIVAVMSLDGGNQEDALILKRSAIDYGMFRSWVIGTVESKEQKVNGRMEKFVHLTEKNSVGRKRGDYGNLEGDGLIRVGALVESDTVIMSKGIELGNTIRKKNKGTKQVDQHANSQTYRDQSILMKSTEHGIIDRVMLTTEDDGLKLAKVRYRKICVPRDGDKLSSRHGQKGTIGTVKALEDLPFTGDGLVPDVVINGLAFTSRMTFGQMFETILAVICAQNGKFGDGTPYSKRYREALYKTKPLRERYFKEKDVQGEMADALRVLGYHPGCDRVLYSGVTGEQLKGQIFMGLTYYQKLKHMVDDKIRARARGRNHIRTRQPVEGRVKDGSLKMGEMEKDGLLAHGASNLIRERLFKSSDPCYLHVCTECQFSSIYPEVLDEAYCSYCKRYDTSLQVFLPHGCKTWMQELMAVGIAMKLKVTPVSGQTNKQVCKKFTTPSYLNKLP